MRRAHTFTHSSQTFSLSLSVCPPRPTPPSAPPLPAAPTAPTAPSQLGEGWSFFRGRVGALGAGALTAPRCPRAQRRSATAHRGPRGQRGGELAAVRDCAHHRSMQVRPDHTFSNLLASYPDPAPPVRPALTARVPRRARKERLSYTGRREARAAQHRSSEGAEPPLHARRDGRSRGHRLHEGAIRRGTAADQAAVLVCVCVSRCGRPSPHRCATLVVGHSQLIVRHSARSSLTPSFFSLFLQLPPRSTCTPNGVKIVCSIWHKATPFRKEMQKSDFGRSICTLAT